MLWKSPAPRRRRTFYGSKHQKAGVECHAVPHAEGQGSKDRQDVHIALADFSPKHYIKETCLTCHSKWTEKQAVYAIDSLHRAVSPGKVRKAEFWLTRFVDKFEEAQEPRRRRVKALEAGTGQALPTRT
jgi:nitrite reductase (cytochrome c-552)